MEKPVSCPLGANASNGARIYPLTLERIYKIVQLAAVLVAVVWSIATQAHATRELSAKMLAITVEMASMKDNITATSYEVARMKAFEEGRQSAVAAAALARDLLEREEKREASRK